MTGFLPAGFGRPRRPPAGERRFGWPPAPAPGSGGGAARLLLFLVLAAAAAGGQTPVDVPVTAVPITAASTEADYFVLYVKHELSEDDVRHVAVSLTRGEAGTTALKMTVPGLPADRYKVEKYAVANPADVDGDGKDDMTDPNPLNAVRPIAPEDGASRMSTTAEWKEFQFDRFPAWFAPGDSFIKGMTSLPTRPSVYFVNGSKHREHFALRGKMPGTALRYWVRFNLDRETGMAGTEDDVVTYYFWHDDMRHLDLWQSGSVRYPTIVPVVHSVLSANLPIMAAEATKWRLAYYIPRTNVPANLKDFVAGYERAGIAVLTDRSFAPDAPVISVSGGPAITEGQAATFTFTADKAPKEDLTLKLYAGQCRGCDFLASFDLPSVTLPKGATTVDWSAATVNDGKPERDGWTYVTLYWNGRKYFMGSRHVRVDVFDDDLKASLSVSPNPVDEGEPASVEARLTASLSADVTIPLVVTAGSAEAGDYAAPASVTVAKGKTSGKAALSTVADLDTDGETLTVALDEANLPAGVLVGSPKSVTISIADLTPAVSLSVSDNPVEEGGVTDVEATLTKSWPSDLTIPLVVTAGTAEADDYAAPASVAITKGGTSGKAALSTVADLSADDETLTVALDEAKLPAGVAAGSPTSVDLVIRDTTPTTAPEVTLEADPAALDEGESATVTARLERALPEAVTIPLSVKAGSAEPEDYDAPASIVVSAAATSGSTTFRTNGDHDTESESLTLSLGALPAEVQAGSPSSVAMTIEDTTTPVDVTLAASPNPAPEGTAATVTATLSAALGRPVTIPLTTAAGSAEDGDFAAPPAVTVAAGEISAAASLSTVDDVDEDDETLTVSLGSPLPPGLRPGSPAS
ncbi:MAG: hypothetical protein OXU63_03740, partial [Acidobacteriota bacterium]|nr:hypothetical protein [Acidobacteriota bacterium]